MKIRALMLLVFLLGFSLVAPAQTSRGTVSGIVTDPTGAVIAGAQVTLTNDQTSLSRTSTTNDEGFYRFDAVDLGTYTVKVTAPNFGELTKTGVTVQANQTADVTAQLAPAGQQVTVDVTSEATAILQTEAPVRGGNIETRQVTELPFAGRNPVALALTLPGVSTNRFGFGVGTFSVNGGRGRSNNFLIDGTENNDISVAGQAFQITNPDAVQEVSVQTSNYDAEFGRAGGAVVNTITKSGGNEFHGTLAFLYDTTHDDAITNTQALDPGIALRGHPPYGTEQWYSGTVGGPLYLPHFGEGKPIFGYHGENKTFFFIAFQDQRQASNTTTTITTLSPAGRARLRSLFPAGTNGNVDTYLGLTQGTDATSQFFNVALGAATAGGVDRGDIQFGSAVTQFAQRYVEPQFQIRIDHKIGDNDQFSARYLFDDQLAPVGGATLGLPGFTTSAANRFQNLLFSETHVFSPNVTNELRIAYNRITIGFPLDPPNPLGLSLPSITISGVTNLSGRTTNLGIQTNLPQGRFANNYVLQDTMTYIRGDHTFRFGLDILNQRSKQFAPIIERGSLTYQASTATPATGFANFVDNFGGSGGTANRDFGSPVYYPFLIRQAYFLQDRWKVTEALTLTLGVRYERFGQAINTLRTAAFTGLFNVDPVTLQGPYSQPSKVAPDNNNFAPTFGIAYSPSFTEGVMGRIFGDKKSVIRAGYQIGYDSFFNNIASNAATSSPNVVATTFTSPNTGRGTANFSSAFPATPRRLSPADAQTLADPNLVNPYYQRWSLGIQRALPFNLLLDLSYVGSKGTKLYLNEDRNPLVPAALRVTPAAFTTAPAGIVGVPTLRLDNLQGGRTIRSNSGSSTYHSGQVDVIRRFSDGFMMRGNYTWSKLIDNGSEVFASTGLINSSLAIIPVILGGERNERALSLFDRTHHASITFVYSIPFMSEQRGALGRLLGGWEISGVQTWETGVPFTVANGADSNGFGGNNDRPDFNPAGQRGVRAVPAVATATLNPCSVAIGATFYRNPDAGNVCINPANAEFIGLLAGIGRTGTLGRNTQRTAGRNNLDFNILKRLRLSETTRLEFRAEFYNIFNHPQYGTGSVSPFSPGGAGPSATVLTSPAGAFLNNQTGDGGGRVVRYQVKFVF